MMDQLEELVSQAVARAFETMLSLEVTALPASSGNEVWNGEPHIAGSVGFIGRLTGVIYIYSTVRFARQVTCRLLGIEETEIEGDEMINDAMGELTNMVVGQIKSQLSDRGLPCVLTIPSIVRGSHFEIESVSTACRRMTSFTCGEYRLAVETLIKPT